MSFKPTPCGELHPSHLPLADRDQLTAMAEVSRLVPYVIAPFDTGWFVQVGAPEVLGTDLGDDAHRGVYRYWDECELGPEFKAILKEANEAGLAFLRIHADAEVDPARPTFDW